MNALRLILLLVCAMLSFAAMGHEGHGHEHPWTVKHYLVNPVHGIPVAMVIILVLVIIVRHYLNVKRARK